MRSTAPRSLVSVVVAVMVAMVGLALAAGCGRNRDEERAAQHASKILGAPAASLRITSQSELTGGAHDFYLASTEDESKSLVVVVPKQGEIFDAQTKDAFDRVSRGEHATEKLSQIGAERVASWFAALGKGVCPLPPVDQAHFVDVNRLPDGGVQLSYAAAHRICVIHLRADGSVESAKNVESLGPSAAGPKWATPPSQ